MSDIIKKKAYFFSIDVFDNNGFDKFIQGITYLNIANDHIDKFVRNKIEITFPNEDHDKLTGKLTIFNLV